MRCEDVASLLLPALHDKLREREREALDGHLAECERCSHDLPRMTQVWALLDAWGDEEVPAGLTARIVDLGRVPRGGHR